MDPLTHALIGTAISAFSGTEVSLYNPLTVGAMLGAVSPDFDFVIRLFKDDAAYLEHHRGISHSVPFLAGFSLVITVVLSQLGFVNFNFLQTLLWTFIGALSHTGFDILNSYGAKLFRKKIKANILTLYDPVITMVGLGFILNGKNSVSELVFGVSIIVVYLAIRNHSRLISMKKLNEYFSNNYVDVDVHVMPSLHAFYKWDFVAHTSTHDIVGKYNPFLIMIKNSRPIKIIKTLRVDDQSYFDVFKSSAVGEIFTGFSPNLHIKVTKDFDNDQIVLRAIDLRYFTNQEFMHHATLTLDSELNFISSHLHPYKIDKAIPIYQ